MDFSKIEEKILKFWQRNKIFERSIKQRLGKPFFSFYDGPPFATGKPHYGHILITTIKDTVLRYWTMKGYQVPRRVGWDCHGLPVENLIEKELGIKNKKEIEKLGIEKFNRACRNSVFRCVKDFEETLKRVGRWADYKAAYATLDSEYIESVWWVFRQLWQEDLVYKDYRVSTYCPRCGTSLSNFEVNLGYKDVKDPSIFIKFRIQNSKLRIANSYFLVWTTTPWTLPGNTALAINSKAKYLLIKQAGENYILAEKRKEVLKGKYQVIKEFLGKDLIGLRYEPLFDSLLKQKPVPNQTSSSLGIKNIENAFQVLPADFVSLKDGTGIVHIAVMYGEEDFQLGKKFNLPFHHTVDQEGFFKKEVKEFAGQFVKNTDQKIIENLAKKGLLYKTQEVLHSYPFCWRCDTPLLYYAQSNWYIAVTKIKRELIKNNKKIHWVPNHIKHGRFGKWLAEARDWAFSRNRFWGAPIPVWICQTGKSEILNPKPKTLKENKFPTGQANSKSKALNLKPCGNIQVIGSIKELERLGGKKPKNLHRPYIDEITFKCDKCNGIMRRIPEVFDCWFESGSMPYSQWHYPFENKKLVEKTFPADFIAEGLDQTRGWFYTLHVLATILTLKNRGLGKEQPAFKNVIVNGLILDSQGKKLSKRLENYPEPSEIFNRYGADSLRYFLLSSTPMGEDYRFSIKGVEEAWRKIISTFWHSFLFFQTYKDKKYKAKKIIKSANLLDKWIISRLNLLNREVVNWMNQYELTKAARLFNQFLDDLSNWYIRRSRRRFQRPETKKELKESSQALGFVLLTLSKLTAPFIPFISEEIYQQLLKCLKSGLKQSVHLENWPKADKKLIDEKLNQNMEKIREIAALALNKRAKAGIKVRQPLNELRITNYELRKEKELLELLKEEVNIKKITFGQTLKLDTKITQELREEGMVREIIRHIQEMRKQEGFKPKDKILINYCGEQEINKILEKNKEFILQETLAEKFTFKKMLKKGKLVKIDRFSSLLNSSSKFSFRNEMKNLEEMKNKSELWLKIKKV